MPGNSWYGVDSVTHEKSGLYNSFEAGKTGDKTT